MKTRRATCVSDSGRPAGSQAKHPVSESVIGSRQLCLLPRSQATGETFPKSRRDAPGKPTGTLAASRPTWDEALEDQTAAERGAPSPVPARLGSVAAPQTLRLMMAFDEGRASKGRSEACSPDFQTPVWKQTRAHELSLDRGCSPFPPVRAATSH